VSLAPFSRIASVLTFFFFWSRITLNCCYFKRIAAVAASTAKLPFSMPFLLSPFTSLFRYLFSPTKTRQRTQFLHNALNIPVLCFIFCSWIPSFNLNGKRLLPSNLPASGKTSIPWGNFRRGGVPHFPPVLFSIPHFSWGQCNFYAAFTFSGSGFRGGATKCSTFQQLCVCWPQDKSSSVSCWQKYSHGKNISLC